MNKRFKHKDKKIFICVLCALCVEISFAQQWHNGDGVVIMANITPEQARTEALNLARQDALGKASVEIRGAGKDLNLAPTG